MNFSIDSIRERALRNGMLADPDAIRWRVSRGDSALSQRVLLTALIKGDDQTRSRILREVRKEYFGQHLLGDVFEWVVRELRLRGQVRFSELYRKMESYVVSRVMPENLAIVDTVVTIAQPDEHAVEDAIGLLRKRFAGHVDCASHADELNLSQRLILAALVKCGPEIQCRILDELSVSHFEHLTLGLMFEWIESTLQAKGAVDENSLYRRLEDYVTCDVQPGYMAVVDHILSIEVPDAETIDQAIAWLQKRHG